jgi:hypothetical protein
MFETTLTYFCNERHKQTIEIETDIKILVSGNESGRASFNFSFERKFSIFQFHTFTDGAVK